MPKAMFGKVRLIPALVLLTTFIVPATSFAAESWAQERARSVRKEVSFHFTVFTTAVSNAVITYGQNKDQPAGVREQKAAGAFVATVVMAEQVRFLSWLLRAD